MDRPCSIAVGGGLAGAAFALELARHGKRVLVVEKSRHPHPKVCGEFLSAEAQELLDYLGLDLANLGATRIEKLRLGCRRRFADAPLPFRGVALSRARLDEALLEAAAKAGAEVKRGATVSTIKPVGDHVIVKAGARTYAGDAIALATGKHSLREFPRPRSDMVGFKLQVRLAPAAAEQLQGVVQLVFFGGGYIGACLVEDNLAPVCWVVRRSLLKDIGSDWAAQRAFFSAQSELLGELLEGAVPAQEKPVAIAQIPYGYLRRQAIAPSIFPLGDQLAVIPSLTGDGMSIALYTGIAAAQAVLSGLDARMFQKQMINGLERQFRWANAVNTALEKSILHGIGISVARALPNLVTWIARSTRLREDLWRDPGGLQGSVPGSQLWP